MHRAVVRFGGLFELEDPGVQELGLGGLDLGALEVLFEEGLIVVSVPPRPAPGGRLVTPS